MHSTASHHQAGLTRSGMDFRFFLSLMVLFFFDRASPVCPQPAARAAGVRARGGGQSDAPDAVPTRTAQKSI